MWKGKRYHFHIVTCEVSRFGRNKADKGYGYEKAVGKGYDAYLTVWVALCLTLILSLCLTLIDGARRNGARMEVECVTDIALQSILAEYHRELMRQYNLFAIDASYGTALCSKSNIETHLRNYIEKNLNYDDVFLAKYLYGDLFGIELREAQLSQGAILTDFGGAVFRKCAADAMKADVGLELLKDIQEWMWVMEVNGLEERDTQDEKKALDDEIDSYNGIKVEVKEDEWETLEIENPTSKLEEKRKEGILKLVLPEEELSQRVLNAEGLIGNRIKEGYVNQGSMGQEEQSATERLIEKFLFQEYLLQYMGRYGKEKESAALCYQIEYLIAGNEVDVDNLKSVANRICAVREAANAVYLVSCQEKMEEISAVAQLVCTIITLPELTPLLESAIVLGWAFAESIYDVKLLLAGKSVPLLKDDSTWHYGLKTALKGEFEDDVFIDERKETQKAGEEEEMEAQKAGKEEGKEAWKEEEEEGKEKPGSETEEGLKYDDYLRIFMMLADTDTVTVRAMDLVEADIRNTDGNGAFRLDGCYEMVEVYLQFDSCHGYEYQIRRQKSYVN